MVRSENNDAQLFDEQHTKEDLTITYYSAMAIVKAILAAAGIIAIAIVCKNETKK